MEAIAATRLSELAEKENLLPDIQIDFRKERSTEAAVTVLAQLHIWHKSHTLPGSSICTVACLLHCIPCL